MIAAMPLMLSSDFGDEQTAAAEHRHIGSLSTRSLQGRHHDVSGEHDSCGGRIEMWSEDGHRALPGTALDAR